MPEYLWFLQLLFLGFYRQVPSSRRSIGLRRNLLPSITFMKSFIQQVCANSSFSISSFHNLQIFLILLWELSLSGSLVSLENESVWKVRTQDPENLGWRGQVFAICLVPSDSFPLIIGQLFNALPTGMSSKKYRF